jgi:hypothetical protein
MNKLIVFLILFGSISLMGFAQPKFVIIGGDEYNWGKVKSTLSPVKAAITFKNEGTEKLVISKVKPGCGCTAAKPEKDTLSPGETTVMNVELKLSGNGVMQKNITIGTNDPDKKTTNFKLVVDVVRDIIFKPSEMMPFKGEDVIVGKETSTTVYIKNNSEKDIKFYDLQVEPNIIKLTIPKEFTIKPGEEVDVVGRITPTKAGHFSSKITFKTDNPDYPIVTIHAHGQVNQNPVINESESAEPAPKATKQQ